MRVFTARVEKFEGCGEKYDFGCRNFDFGFTQITSLRGTKQSLYR